MVIFVLKIWSTITKKNRNFFCRFSSVLERFSTTWTKKSEQIFLKGWSEYPQLGKDPFQNIEQHMGPKSQFGHFWSEVGGGRRSACRSRRQGHERV